jgi:hypothetical protein
MRISTFRCRGWTTVSRVEWRHAWGEFARFGYFGEKELSPEKPLLFMLAPALHVHPARDILLHYISPEIDWVSVGIDERWREGVKVAFRKRPVVDRSSFPESRRRAEA